VFGHYLQYSRNVINIDVFTCMYQYDKYGVYRTDGNVTIYDARDACTTSGV